MSGVHFSDVIRPPSLKYSQIDENGKTFPEKQGDVWRAETFFADNC